MRTLLKKGSDSRECFLIQVGIQLVQERIDKSSFNV